MSGEIGSARISGLGGINNSIARDDPQANPAGLASSKDSKVMSTYEERFSGSLTDGSLCMTLKNLAFKVDYVTVPGIEKYNEAGDREGETSLNEWYLSAMYGLQLSQALSLGAGVNMISRSANRQSNFGGSISLGAQYRLSDTISLGAVVDDIGAQSSLNRQGRTHLIPTTLRAGLQVSPFEKIHLVGGGAFAGTLRPEWSLGAEYDLLNSDNLELSVRAGYDGGRRLYGPLSIGFGVNIQGMVQLDYANNVHPVLGNTSVFSLTFAIDKLFRQPQ